LKGAQGIGLGDGVSNYSNYGIEKIINEHRVYACLQKLKLGRAAGNDNLTAEHLLYASPAVVTHLTALFRCVSKHGIVPDSWGSGIVIPIIKDKLADENDLNNYRGITLIPVISKLYELLMLDICEPYLRTADLQFGFKQKVGCTNAVFVFTEIVKYYLDNHSSIFGAALDVKKAFDRVSHYKLFTVLIKRQVPVWIIKVLVNWYSKLYVSVRWRNVLSYSYQVLSGVRQGGATLSSFI